MLKRLLILMCLAAIVLMIVGFYGNHFDEGKMDREVSIRWEMVNVRENHSTSSEILSSLYNGDEVTLTGNSFEYFCGDNLPTDSWAEVKLPDGTIGWVVTSSIAW